MVTKHHRVIIYVPHSLYEMCAGKRQKVISCGAWYKSTEYRIHGVQALNKNNNNDARSIVELQLSGRKKWAV